MSFFKKKKELIECFCYGEFEIDTFKFLVQFGYTIPSNSSQLTL